MAVREIFPALVSPLAEMLAPGRTALMLIDIQNDFGHPEGLFGRLEVDLSRVDAAVDNAERLATQARIAGVPVIFVRLETSAQRDSPSAALRRARRGTPVSESGRVCRLGSWGAAHYRIAPHSGELEVSKWRYSAFVGTGLSLLLAAMKVDTLVVCGLTTECCVETSVRDGFHHDLHMFIASDASASYETDLHEGSLKNISLNFGLALRTTEILAAWSI